MSRFRKAASAAVPRAGRAAPRRFDCRRGQPTSLGGGATTTPIKHLVVIFQENVSFDHYFGTYPTAANTSGQPFQRAKKTRTVNTLATTPGAGGKGTLLTNNPNRDAGGSQVNPRRLDPANINDVLTCDQDHDYGDEQKAFDGGTMDKFVTTVGNAHGKERHRPGLPGQRRHELLRRQHGDRPVELRPAVRDERQLLRHDLRPVGARARSTWSPATPAASG